MNLILTLIGFFVILRLSARLERRLQARRILHSIVAPLYTYLGLLDHELQNENYHADRLITQAVLDHVTELRAFLLQPHSKDLYLLSVGRWTQNLNKILLGLEESLEGALQEDWDRHFADIKEQVARLNGFLKDIPELHRMIQSPPGVVANV